MVTGVGVYVGEVPADVEPAEVEPAKVEPADVEPCVVETAVTPPETDVTAHPRKFGIVILTRAQRLKLNDTASATTLSGDKA